MSRIADRVTLREITAETVRAVVKLAVAEDQNRFVAPNAVSLAQALFAPEAWYRAIYLDDELVGFVMLSDDSLLDPPPEQPEVGLWRFMVDARYQGQGVGRAALQLIIDHVRRKGRFEKLSLSYVPEDGGPEAFYRSFGFLPTGEIDDGEVVMELLLGDGSRSPDARPERLLQLARDVAEGQVDFDTVKGPGAGDRATLTYMAALREAAREAFGVDLSEFRGCGETALAADFYFPDEGVMVEIALGLPNPGSEFEKDIVKALMAKELGHDVRKLMFISRPGAAKKCAQPGRRAMIDWARARHGIEIEVHELDGEPRPRRVRRRTGRRVEFEDPSAA